MNRSDLEGAEIRRGMKLVAFAGSQLPRGKTPAPATYSTAGAVTFTAADVLGGIIVHDPNGAARTDVLPTAALLVASAPWLQIGDIIRCLIINGSDGAADAENITLAGGTGGTFDANQVAAARVIRSQSSKDIAIRFTGVASGSEAYVVYM